ncbi:MAG TPA: histidine kinase [Thiopseudomonas sp.]|nr:histidine kinase [Thiopseudomonas sp.]
MPLASAPLKRTSIASRITGYVFLMISISLLSIAGLVYTQQQWSIQQQADALGKSLLQQTRVLAEGALSAEDTLSLAVLLRELVGNPYVSHAALYSVDNRILAEAGQRPKSSSNAPGFYSQQLTFQNIIAGTLHLHIDMQQLQKPLDTSMQTLAAVGLVLLMLSAILAVLLGRSIARPLNNLSNWLSNPAPPAPCIQRSDEVGVLARQLNQHWASDLSTVEPQPAELTSTVLEPQQAAANQDPSELSYQQVHDTVLADAHNNTRTAVLAIELGSMEQLRQLPSERLSELMNQYLHALQQAADLYAGELYNLTDGRSLITFHSKHADYPRNAVLCGELLRAFSHALQTEVAASGILLHIKLGLSDGPAQQQNTLGQLLLNDSTQAALTLSKHSHNLLLLSNDLAQQDEIIDCSRTRPVLKPEQASCVETLLDNYPALLQEQLQQIQMRTELGKL